MTPEVVRGGGALASPDRRAQRRLQKRSLSLAGHSTSVALEPEFWVALEALARARDETLSGLVAKLDVVRGDRPLASALRVAALLAAVDGAQENVGRTP